MVLQSTLDSLFLGIIFSVIFSFQHDEGNVFYCVDVRNENMSPDYSNGVNELLEHFPFECKFILVCFFFMLHKIISHECFTSVVSTLVYQKRKHQTHFILAHVFCHQLCRKYKKQQQT